MSTNRQTAHGKIIWMGEHAVVYGHAALALPALNATVDVALTDSSQRFFESPFYTGAFESAPALLTPIRSLFEQLSDYFHAAPLTLSITPHLPLAGGMGSSAAIAAAMTKAFFDRYQRTLDAATLQEWIQRSETLAHGKPKRNRRRRGHAGASVSLRQRRTRKVSLDLSKAIFVGCGQRRIGKHQRSGGIHSLTHR
ncbi:MAG: hypothetical protein MZU97_19675 [Bacillus subtilis]|nr:hypothetical protein [Bacillus subtilis]